MSLPDPKVVCRHRWISEGTGWGPSTGWKFEDLNGNGVWDRRPPLEVEPGLAGVEIYVDLNHNGQWDREEPKTLTQSDNPATKDIDETGAYELVGLPPSQPQPGSDQLTSYTVAEVLQPGWVQTFPGDAEHAASSAAAGAHPRHTVATWAGSPPYADGDDQSCERDGGQLGNDPRRFHRESVSAGPRSI